MKLPTIRWARYPEVPLILVVGAITTPERFRVGFVSLAHVMGDGRIMEHGQQVGVADDLEYGEEVDVTLDEDAFFANVGTRAAGWRRRR